MALLLYIVLARGVIRGRVNGALENRTATEQNYPQEVPTTRSHNIRIKFPVGAERMRPIFKNHISGKPMEKRFVFVIAKRLINGSVRKHTNSYAENGYWHISRIRNLN